MITRPAMTADEAAHEFVEVLAGGTFIGVGYEFNWPTWWMIVLAITIISGYRSAVIRRRLRESKANG